MRRLLTILLALALSGCGVPMNSYIATFDLRHTVCALSDSGLYCSGPSGDGIGASGARIDAAGRTRDASLSTTEIFPITAAGRTGFDVDRFIAEFAGAVARDLNASGFVVDADGAAQAVTLYYRDGTITGELQIKGHRANDELILDINARETAKN